MKSRERREAIVQMARSNGLASVAELSEFFQVTASTIRRDLALLTESGDLVRTYGGAMSVPSHHEQTLSERSGEHLEQKAAIGAWAAQQVHEGDVVLLDAGTTSAQMARALRGRGHFTVVTTGLTPLAEVAQDPDIQSICVGGEFRPVSEGFIGPLAEAAVEKLTFDACFLGADGVVAELGLCEATLDQTRLKELMIRRSSKVYLLMHADKLGQAPFNAWTRLPEGWTLVTDWKATPEQLAPFHAAGVDVQVAQPKV